MLEFRGEGVTLRKSMVFCENLRFELGLSPKRALPKGPGGTKNTTRSKFTTRSEFATRSDSLSR